MRWPALLVLALSLAACDPVGRDSGYVEIRGLAGFSPMPELYLDDARVEFPRAGQTILRKAAGAAKLRWLKSDVYYDLCAFGVRKNRIVTLTLAAVDRKLRCDVQS